MRRATTACAHRTHRAQVRINVTSTQHLHNMNTAPTRHQHRTSHTLVARAPDSPPPSTANLVRQLARFFIAKCCLATVNCGNLQVFVFSFFLHLFLSISARQRAQKNPCPKRKLPSNCAATSGTAPKTCAPSATARAPRKWASTAATMPASLSSPYSTPGATSTPATRTSSSASKRSSAASGRPAVFQWRFRS